MCYFLHSHTAFVAWAQRCMFGIYFNAMFWCWAAIDMHFVTFFSTQYVFTFVCLYMRVFSVGIFTISHPFDLCENWHRPERAMHTTTALLPKGIQQTVFFLHSPLLFLLCAKNVFLHFHSIICSLNCHFPVYDNDDDDDASCWVADGYREDPWKNANKTKIASISNVYIRLFVVVIIVIGLVWFVESTYHRNREKEEIVLQK